MAAIELETYFLFLDPPLAISLVQLLQRQRRLAIVVASDFWRGEHGVNAMDTCPTNAWNVGFINGLCSCITKIVNINLQ